MMLVAGGTWGSRAALPARVSGCVGGYQSAGICGDDLSSGKGLL